MGNCSCSSGPSAGGDEASPAPALEVCLWAVRLTAHFRGPGDGRGRPQIPAAALMWALVIGQILREPNFRIAR